MKSFMINICRFNEKGITLIELLASIVLVTLLLTSFLMVFGQSAKTNNVSETILDGTYFAQEEMEKLIGVSKQNLLSNRTNALLTMGYSNASVVTVANKQWLKYEKNLERSNLKAVLRIENNSDSMGRTIIEIYEGNKVLPNAKMENILVWEVIPK